VSAPIEPSPVVSQWQEVKTIEAHRKVP